MPPTIASARSRLGIRSKTSTGGARRAGGSRAARWRSGPGRRRAPSGPRFDVAAFEVVTEPLSVQEVEAPRRPPGPDLRRDDDRELHRTSRDGRAASAERARAARRVAASRRASSPAWTREHVDVAVLPQPSEHGRAMEVRPASRRPRTSRERREPARPGSPWMPLVSGEARLGALRVALEVDDAWHDDGERPSSSSARGAAAARVHGALDGVRGGRRDHRGDGLPALEGELDADRIVRQGDTTSVRTPWTASGWTNATSRPNRPTRGASSISSAPSRRADRAPRRRRRPRTRRGACRGRAWRGTGPRGVVAGRCEELDPARRRRAPRPRRPLGRRRVAVLEGPPKSRS